MHYFLMGTVFILQLSLISALYFGIYHLRKRCMGESQPCSSILAQNLVKEGRREEGKKRKEGEIKKNQTIWFPYSSKLLNLN